MEFRVFYFEPTADFRNMMPEHPQYGIPLIEPIALETGSPAERPFYGSIVKA